MAEDALTRLKNRQRPQVPARDPSLLTTATSAESDTHNNPLDTQPPTTIEPTQASTTTSAPLDTQSDAQLVRTSVRLEPLLDSELERFCKSHRITRELFLEAAFALAQQQPTLLEQIATDARKRRIHRLKLAERKRLLTLQQKIDDLRE